MPQTYRFEELDEATRSYLHLARDSRGRGMPGVYAPKTDYLPWVGLLVGLGLIGFALYMTLPPGPFDAPTNTAFLQMAALLPGVWMLTAAIRVWLARGTATNVGHFIYADSLRLYDCSGSSVCAYDLEGAGRATGIHNYSEGRYSNSTVTVSMGFGQKKFTVHSEKAADRLIAFLNTLNWLRSAGAAVGETLSPVAMGVLARQTAHDGKVPEAINTSDSLTDAIPEPLRVGEARSGMFWYALIVVGAVLGVFVMREVDVMLRDDNLFEMVKDSRPPDLRAYLADPWTGQHREEVERRLAAFYQPAINQFKQQARTSDVARGPLEIFERLKSAPQPVVSVRVAEQRDPERRQRPFDDSSVEQRRAAVQKRFVDAFNMGFGQDLVAFAEVKDEPPAMMDITYRFKPDADRPGKFRVEFSLTFRPGPEDQVVASKKWTGETAGADPAELQRSAIGTAKRVLQDLGGATLARAGDPANAPKLPGGPNMPFGPGFPGAPQ